MKINWNNTVCIHSIFHSAQFCAWNTGNAQYTIAAIMVLIAYYLIYLSSVSTFLLSRISSEPTPFMSKQTLFLQALDLNSETASWDMRAIGRWGSKSNMAGMKGKQRGGGTEGENQSQMTWIWEREFGEGKSFEHLLHKGK